MACSVYTLKGMPQECKGSVAGLKELYLGLLDDVSGVTTTTAHTCTITMKTGKKLYSYFVTDESSSLTSTLNRNSANGVLYYLNEISASFVKMTEVKLIALLALANDKMVAVAVDNNNKAWFLGADSFVTAGEETAQTGQSFDDLSGYQVTLNHRSAALPYEISDWDTFKDSNTDVPEPEN